MSNWAGHKFWMCVFGPVTNQFDWSFFQGGGWVGWLLEEGAFLLLFFFFSLVRTKTQKIPNQHSTEHNWGSILVISVASLIISLLYITHKKIMNIEIVFTLASRIAYRPGQPTPIKEWPELDSSFCTGRLQPCLVSGLIAYKGRACANS